VRTRRVRVLDEGHLLPSAGRHGLFDGALLDLGALRRDADQDARLREPSRRHAAEYGGEVALGHLELGDRALAQRSHGNDVAGIAADQIPGSLTDRDDGASVRVQRHDRRLIEDDPLALAVDDRIRRSEVDREVPPHQDPITQWPSPVARSSFFQIGTSCFSCSIPSRHAATASPRWAEETATTTLASPTPRSPMRWSRATFRTGQRARRSSAISWSRSTAISFHDSYVTPDTTPPLASASRTVPTKMHDPPAEGSPMNASASSTDSGSAATRTSVWSSDTTPRLARGGEESARRW